MRIKRTLILAALLAAVLCTACASEKGTQEPLPQLVIGSDNYRPYHYLDENDRPAGIDVELAREACRRMGYEPVFIQIDWDRKDTLLENGIVDCLWGCFSMNGRETDYLWAGPYLYSRQLVAVRADSDITSLDDLAGKRVAVQISSKAEDILSGAAEQPVPEVGTLYCLLDMDELATALRKHYVDACASHAAALAESLGNAGVDYRFLEPELLRSDLGVAFAPDGDAALCARLNETLEEMRGDGTIARILTAYGMDPAKNMVEAAS